MYLILDIINENNTFLKSLKVFDNFFFLIVKNYDIKLEFFQELGCSEVFRNNFKKYFLELKLDNYCFNIDKILNKINKNNNNLIFNSKILKEFKISLKENKIDLNFSCFNSIFKKLNLFFITYNEDIINLKRQGMIKHHINFNEEFQDFFKIDKKFINDIDICFKSHSMKIFSFMWYDKLLLNENFFKEKFFIFDSILKEFIIFPKFKSISDFENVFSKLSWFMNHSNIYWNENINFLYFYSLLRYLIINIENNSLFIIKILEFLKDTPTYENIKNDIFIEYFRFYCNYLFKNIMPDYMNSCTLGFDEFESIKNKFINYSINCRKEILEYRDEIVKMKSLKYPRTIETVKKSPIMSHYGSRNYYNLRIKPFLNCFIEKGFYEKKNNTYLFYNIFEDIYNLNKKNMNLKFFQKLICNSLNIGYEKVYIQNINDSSFFFKGYKVEDKGYVKMFSHFSHNNYPKLDNNNYPKLDNNNNYPKLDNNNNYPRLDNNNNYPRLDNYY